MEKSIAEFPINAEQGIGMVDTTIIQEYKECVQRFTGWIVKIWTSNGHLAGYEHYPSLRKINIIYGSENEKRIIFQSVLFALA